MFETRDVPHSDYPVTAPAEKEQPIRDHRLDRIPVALHSTHTTAAGVVSICRENGGVCGKDISEERTHDASVPLTERRCLYSCNRGATHDIQTPHQPGRLHGPVVPLASPTRRKFAPGSPNIARHGRCPRWPATDPPRPQTPGKGLPRLIHLRRRGRGQWRSQRSESVQPKQRGSGGSRRLSVFGVGRVVERARWHAGAPLTGNRYRLIAPAARCASDVRNSMNTIIALRSKTTASTLSGIPHRSKKLRKCQQHGLNPNLRKNTCALSLSLSFALSLTLCRLKPSLAFVLHMAIVPSKPALATINDPRRSLYAARALTVFSWARNDSPAPVSSRQNRTVPSSVPEK